MLYVFHGSDTHAALTKANIVVASLRAKKPDASYVRVEAGQWTPSIIEEHLGGQGLFSNKYIIFLDRVTENIEAKEQLPEFIEAIQESSNIFILLETKLNAELKKAVEKHAEKVVECGKEEKVGAYAGGAGGANSGSGFGKSDESNVFALADAFGYQSIERNGRFQLPGFEFPSKDETNAKAYESRLFRLLLHIVSGVALKITQDAELRVTRRLSRAIA